MRVKRAPNPYVIGRPIHEAKLFFGREELFQFIEDNLVSEAGIILLRGQRRIGKSSVLRQIPLAVDLEQFKFIYFDLQDGATLSLEKVLSNLMIEINNEVSTMRDHDVQLPSLQKIKENPIFSIVNYCNEIAQAIGGKHLVLLLDEFDALDFHKPEYQHFLRQAQEIIYAQRVRVSLIPVVGRRLDEMKYLVEFFRGSPSQEIGLLDAQSAKKLIVQPAQEDLCYEDTAIAKIIELSAGHPYFTQLLCHSIFSRMRDQNDATVTSEDVEAVVPRALVSGEPGLIWFREGLPVSEKVLLLAIAQLQEQKLKVVPMNVSPAQPLPLQLLEKYGVSPTELLTQAEMNLLEWGFIKQSSTLDSYQITIELVRLWLIRKYALQTEIRELENIDPQAKACYETALSLRKSGDLAQALSLCEQALTINPNYFPALFEQASICFKGKDFARAIGLYTRAVKVDRAKSREDELILAYVSYGDQLIDAGELSLAKEQYSEVLSLDPSHQRATEQLKQVETGIRKKLFAQNPFITSRSASHQFVGREREVGAIFSAIRGGGSIAIYGEPGAGKTSILHSITSPLVQSTYEFDAKKSLMVYINCQNIRPFYAIAFWEEVILEVQERLSLETEKDAKILKELAKMVEDILASEKISNITLNRFLRKLAQLYDYFTILIDEFDSAFKPNKHFSIQDMMEFFTELRGFSDGSRSSISISLVVATRKKLSEYSVLYSSLSSPLPSIFFSLPIESLNEEDAAEIIKQMPADFLLSNDEVVWVNHISRNQPRKLILALSALFELHVQGELFDAETATRVFNSSQIPDQEVVLP